MAGGVVLSGMRRLSIKGTTGTDDASTEISISPVLQEREKAAWGSRVYVCLLGSTMDRVTCPCRTVGRRIPATTSRRAADSAVRA